MSGQKTASLVALAFLGGASAANAQSDWYLSGSAAAYLRQDSTYSASISKPGAAPAADTEKDNYDPGAMVSVGVGKRIGQHLRVEGQLGYAGYTISRINPFTTDPNYPRIDGRAFYQREGVRYTRETADIIGFYDFNPMRWGVTPFLGAGLGASEDHRGAGVLQSADGATMTIQAKSAAELLGLAEFGLSIPLTPGLTLVPNYQFVRYFRRTPDAVNVFGATVRYAF
jgi:Outer membrane protein beta-barrel domain